MYNSNEIVAIKVGQGIEPETWGIWMTFRSGPGEFIFVGSKESAIATLQTANLAK